MSVIKNLLLGGGGLLLLYAGVGGAAYYGEMERQRLAARTVDVVCREREPELRSQFDRLVKEGKHKVAVTLLANCKWTFEKTPFGKDITAAEIVVLRERFNRPKNATDQLIAIQELIRLGDPEASVKVRDQLRKTVRTQEEVRVLEEKLKKKLDFTITIGMSPKDVLDSGWGEPHSTTTRFSELGLIEIWSYNFDGGHQILAFTDGKLSSFTESSR